MRYKDQTGDRCESPPHRGMGGKNLVRVYHAAHPARVLLCHAHDESFKFRINPRATASFSVLEGLLAFDQLAMPLQKGFRLEQE